MKDFLIDKLEYNHDSNKKVLELIFQNEKTYTSTAEKLLNHSFNAQHIWNRRILGGPSDVGVWEVMEFEKIFRFNEANYLESLGILENLNLEQLIKYQTSKGETFHNKIHDIIYHIINHSTYHRGQIITALKFEGAEPVATDFIFYKRKK